MPSGKQAGAKGYEGVVPSDEDNDLARRRFEEYIRLTKGKDYSVPFEEVLPLLPMDGGTKYACGETRFDHAVTGTCVDPERNMNLRCGKEIKGGKFCARKLGHRGKTCESWESYQHKLAGARKRNKAYRGARAVA